ncbi:MAG: hypothetical protein ACR2OD_05970 [Gaiellaceae bacterium]
MLRTALVAVVAALALSACGGSTAPAGEVVENWVEALTTGSDEDAAAFFVDEPIIVQGFLPTLPKTKQGVVSWHAKLDCGGEITGMRVDGRRVSATFALADRVRYQCPAPGYLSTVDFILEDGLIKVWSQALPGTIVESK